MPIDHLDVARVQNFGWKSFGFGVAVAVVAGVLVNSINPIEDLVPDSLFSGGRVVESKIFPAHTVTVGGKIFFSKILLFKTTRNLEALSVRVDSESRHIESITSSSNPSELSPILRIHHDERRKISLCTAEIKNLKKGAIISILLLTRLGEGEQEVHATLKISVISKKDGDELGRVEEFDQSF